MDISMEFIIQQTQFCCLREHQFSSFFASDFSIASRGLNLLKST